MKRNTNQQFKRRTFANSHEQHVDISENEDSDVGIQERKKGNSMEELIDQIYDPSSHGDFDDFIANTDHRLILKKRDESYYANGKMRKVDDVCKTAQHATIVGSFFLMVDGIDKNIDLEDFMTGASMLLSMNNSPPKLAYEEVHAAVSYLVSEEDVNYMEQILTTKQMLVEKTSVRTNASLVDLGVGLVPFSEEDATKTPTLHNTSLTQDFNDSIRVPMLTVAAQTRYEQVYDTVHTYFNTPQTEDSVPTIRRLVTKNKLPMITEHKKLLDHAGIFFPEAVPSAKYGQCSIAAVAVDKYMTGGIDALYVRDFVFSRVGDVVQHHKFGYEKVVPLPLKEDDCSLALLSTVMHYDDALNDLKQLEKDVSEMDQTEKIAASAKKRLHLQHASEYEQLRNNPVGTSPMKLKYATLASPKPLGDKDAMALNQEGKLDRCVFMMRSQDYCRAMVHGLGCKKAVVLDAPSLLLLVFHHSLDEFIIPEMIVPSTGTLVAIEGWFLGVPSMAYTRPAWFNTLTGFCLAHFIAMICGPEYFAVVRDKYNSTALVKNKKDMAGRIFALMESVHKTISPRASYRVYIVPAYGAKKVFKYTGFKDFDATEYGARKLPDDPDDDEVDDDGDAGDDALLDEEEYSPEELASLSSFRFEEAVDDEKEEGNDVDPS